MPVDGIPVDALGKSRSRCWCIEAQAPLTAWLLNIVAWYKCKPFKQA